LILKWVIADTGEMAAAGMSSSRVDRTAAPPPRMSRVIHELTPIASKNAATKGLILLDYPPSRQLNTRIG